MLDRGTTHMMGFNKGISLENYKEKKGGVPGAKNYERIYHVWPY